MFPGSDCTLPSSFCRTPLYGHHMTGSAIGPLRRGVVKAVLEDELLYQLLASVDVIRLGRVRKVALAIRVLKENILGAI